MTIAGDLAGDLASVGAVSGTVAMAGGVYLLRAANRGICGDRIFSRVGGWVLVSAGCCLWSIGRGADLAAALALLVFSLAGYCAVAGALETRVRRDRARRQRHEAADPLVRPRRPWRIGMRILLAGPVSLAFGVAVALIIATRMPVAAVNAVILGGLLGPLAFAVAMAWALSGERLSRVAIGLAVSSLLMTGLSSWPM